MVRRLALAAALALSTSFAAGCAEPIADEESGETASHATTASDAATLRRLENRIDNCYRLSDREFAELSALNPGPFNFSAEVYVYVSCTVSAGGVVSTSASVERRAGLSSSDGSFTETSISATTSINVPVRVVTASGSVAYEHTERATGGVTISKDTSSVSVGVERTFPLARASISASFDGRSGSITGGLASPIEIPISACGAGGRGSFGARVSFSAERNRADIDPATRAKASALMTQYVDNVWVFDLATRTPAEDRRVCCGAQGTCN